MAGTSKVTLLVECEGLGAGVVNIAEKFTDSSIPDDYRRFDTVLSTAAILLSGLVNIPSSEILGLGLIARDGNVYMNTISTAISTAGTYIPSGQSEFVSFSQGNACVIALKGDDADTAVTGLVYSKLTV